MSSSVFDISKKIKQREAIILFNIFQLKTKHNIQFKYCKSHSTDEYHNLADLMAGHEAWACQLLKKPNRLIKRASKIPLCAYAYVRYISPDKRNDLEDVISQDPHTAFLYACNIRRGRFKMGEHAIMNSDKYKDIYLRMIGRETFYSK